MKRLFSSVAAAAVVASAALTPMTGARAQIAPDDSGAGFQRGVAELRASGQVGTVTLHHEGNGTQVIVELAGVPSGRVEPVAIVRGKSCRKLEQVGWVLKPITDETQSSTHVDAPISRLTSGNYVLVVHADDKVAGHNVACGELI